MIVYTYTEGNLLEEIGKELPFVLSMCDKKQEKVDKIIKKSSVFPVRLHSSFRSPLKNEWILLWEAKNKKYIGDNSLVTYVVHYNTPHGRYAIMPTWAKGNLILIMYPPHFFERYKLRAGIELTGTDLMTRFFELNASYGFMSEKETNLGIAITHVYGTCKEGVCMGIQSANYNMILFKTFVTYEMLKGEQIEDFAKTEQIRKEIHEKETDLGYEE